jgi:hypothetical protein
LGAGLIARVVLVLLLIIKAGDRSSAINAQGCLAVKMWLASGVGRQNIQR